MKTIHVVAAAACMAHSAAAFGMAHSSTLPMAGRNHRSAAAAVRMQQETAVAKESKSEGSEGEGVTEVKAAVDNKIGVAVRTRPNVQANQEVNFYARTAVRMGALKETSPLMTSTMPGNKGFDPLGLAKRKDLLLQYREAELKHARLAMLASVGWAASELIHPKLAALLGVKSLLQPGSSGQLEKAPSVLNGGLNAVPPLAWAGLVLITGIVEVWRMLAVAENSMNFTPGDYKFDPLNFYKVADEPERRALQLKEINNGRLAMIAIAVFAAQEFTADMAVVNLAPQYFTAGPLGNIGNIGNLIGQYSGLLSCQSGIVYCSEGQGAMDAIMAQDSAATAEYLQEVLSN